MIPTRVLITDLDGTLLRSMPVAWEYLNRIAIRKKKHLKYYKDYRSTLDLYLDVFKTFGLRALKLLPRMRRYMYLNDSTIEAYTGAIEGIKQLHKMGWKIVIITDNDDDYARKVLLRNGLGSYDWLEIYSAEADTKLGLMIKVLNKYRSAQQLYFASHDTKDFALIFAAMAMTFKTAKPIFTPNEVDKKSFIHPQLTIEQLAKKLTN
jgi:phosphoglycolate phosphatase-like HAD superfamily hydrolase